MSIPPLPPSAPPPTPNIDAPDFNPYLALGGEQGLDRMVRRFYVLMDTDPAYRELRQTHADLERARERLFEFLSGRLGGPNLYIERHGHPRLRARHMPFAIGPRERDQWVDCMNRAMQDSGVAPDLRQLIGQFFAGVAAHMQNRP